MKISEIASKYDIKENQLERFLFNHKEIKTSGVFDKNIDDNDVDKVVSMFKQEKADARAAKRAEEREAAEKLRKEQEKADAEAKEVAEKLRKEQEKEQEKQQAIANMLITSGFNFDGYKITKYSGYISGDDAVQIPRKGWFGTNNTDKQLTDALVKIRIQAIKELKEAAYDLGCNAVIGVDFDYITMDPQTATINGGTEYQPYVVCVTANGNAVVIEKN